MSIPAFPSSIASDLDRRGMTLRDFAEILFISASMIQPQSYKAEDNVAYGKKHADIWLKARES